MNIGVHESLSILVFLVCMPSSGIAGSYGSSELTPKKDVLFIIGDWNSKVGSQETPGVTGKFGLGLQNKAGQRQTVLPRKHTGHNILFQKHKRRLYTWTSQMVNTDIRLIIFFAVKDGSTTQSAKTR